MNLSPTHPRSSLPDDRLGHDVYADMPEVIAALQAAARDSVAEGPGQLDHLYIVFGATTPTGHVEPRDAAPLHAALRVAALAPVDFESRGAVAEAREAARTSRARAVVAVSRVTTERGTEVVDIEVEDTVKGLLVLRAPVRSDAEGLTTLGEFEVLRRKSIETPLAPWRGGRVFPAAHL